MFRLPSIRSKLLALFLVAGAIPVVAVSLIAYFNSLKAVDDMVANRTDRLAASVQEELARKIERRAGDRILHVNAPVQEFLELAQGAGGADYRERQGALMEYLPQLFDRYQTYYDELVIATAEGDPLFKFHRSEGGSGAFAGDLRIETVVASIPGGGIELLPVERETPARDLGTVEPPPEAPVAPSRVVVVRPEPTEHPISEEDRRAAERGADLDPREIRVVSDVPGRGGKRAIRIVHAVFSNRDPSRRLGTLVTNLRTTYIFREDLDADRFGEFGELAIVDRGTGEILFHSDAERIGTRLRRADAGLADCLGTAGYDGGAWSGIDGDHGSRIVRASLVGGTDWLVVATGLPREFQKEARRAGLLNLLVASGAVLAAGVLLLISSGRISRSIQVVTQGAREIAAGNLDHSIEVATHDEIQVLGEAFNRMTASLRENIALRERAAQELEALNRTLEDRVRERTRELQTLNDALNQANQELTELDRLKTHFLATVSHEFKTPLTSIKAFAEILHDEAVDMDAPHEMQRFLRIIDSETDRLGRLIRNLLSLSQIESGRIVWHPSEFLLRGAVDDALDGLLPVIREKRVVIDQDVVCPEVRVHADRDRIQEVVTNLVDNAVKFSGTEGIVRIHCRREPERNGEPPAVRVTIRDFGIGIPSDHLENIFERFSQVDASDTRQKGGTGLGLAICREIVEYHGGKIWAESESGEGTAFHFTLPVADDARDGGIRA